MVMTVQPIDACITHLKAKNYDEIIYMSPDGETLNQKWPTVMYENIIILCGHYKVDQRVRDHFITKKYLLAIMFYPEN
jgi:tRNA (guanine37-N1)-methyltransferase